MKQLLINNKNKILSLLALFLIITIIESTLFNNFFHTSQELYNTRNIFIAGYYLISTFIGCLSIALIPFIKNKIIFLILFCIFILSYVIDITYLEINGYGFGLNELNIAYTEANKFTADVWLSFNSFFYKTLLILIPIVLFIYLLRWKINQQKFYISSYFVWVILFISVMSSYSIIHRSGGYHNEFSTPFRITNIITYYITNRTYYGDREKLLLSPINKTKYNNIIWIIDESAGGKYLSINGYHKMTTPYLNSIRDKYLNLGLASSGSNCSAESNLILLSGIQAKQVPDKKELSLKQPSIFQYAKKAGYRTHYISGQSTHKNLQNYMTKYDLEDIDHFFQPTGKSKNINIPEFNIIEKTHQAINSSDKNFIFIVKTGSHFHWERRYPKSHRIFTPTLEISDNLLINNKEKALNSYANAIRYTVDEFFKAFFDHTKLLNQEKTLIIYTSDHGQSILENNQISTHCDALQPKPSQAIVPLLIFHPENDNLFKTHTFRKNQYSHFQIFPTTLMLFGYQQSMTGKTLFEKNEDNNTFISGDMFGRTIVRKTRIKTFLK